MDDDFPELDHITTTAQAQAFAEALLERLRSVTIPQIDSELAKTHLGTLGLLGPAGSGAQITGGNQ
jgi:hypothetical protein